MKKYLKTTIGAALLTGLLAAGLVAVAAIPGTNSTVVQLLDMFCDACGPATASNIRNLVSSVVTLQDTQTITGPKTFGAITVSTVNGNTFTAGTGALTIAAAKTLTVSNTLTLAGTDSSTVNVGAGGTLAASAYTDTTSATNITSGTLPVARLSLSQITNSLAGNVAVNNTGLFFDGPQIAQGSTGTWFASGTITLDDTAGPATWWCKLWDGTTVIASGLIFQPSGSNPITASLSGYIASPAGNIKISCNDRTSTSGLFLANGTGLGKDSTVSAYRLN